MKKVCAHWMVFHDNSSFHRARHYRKLWLRRITASLLQLGFSTMLLLFEVHQKNYLRSPKFASDDDLISAVASVFETHTNNFFFF